MKTIKLIGISMLMLMLISAGAFAYSKTQLTQTLRFDEEMDTYGNWDKTTFTSDDFDEVTHLDSEWAPYRYYLGENKGGEWRMLRTER